MLFDTIVAIKTFDNRMLPFFFQKRDNRRKLFFLYSDLFHEKLEPIDPQRLTGLNFVNKFSAIFNSFYSQTGSMFHNHYSGEFNC